MLLHVPQELAAGPDGSTEATSYQSPPLRFLNISREVTAITAGSLSVEHPERDILLIGTGTSLQAYDVTDNRDIFFRETTDAVTALAIGSFSGEGGEKLSIAGGNCSLTGYDNDGKDVFWTVAGDVVTACCFGDVDGDGVPELLAGGNDYEISCYKGEEGEITRQTTETDKVVALLLCQPNDLIVDAAAVPGDSSQQQQSQPHRFAYALSNGTVGVYLSSSSPGAFQRAWRVKGRSKPVSLALFDIDGDNTKELLIGYSDGRFEARRVANGEVVYRDALLVSSSSSSSSATTAPSSAQQAGAATSSALAGLIACDDYRGDGKPMLLVIGCDGEVRGYNSSTPEVLAKIRQAVAVLAAAANSSGGGASSGSGGAAPEGVDAVSVAKPATPSATAAPPVPAPVSAAALTTMKDKAGAAAGPPPTEDTVRALVQERAKLEAELQRLMQTTTTAEDERGSKGNTTGRDTSASFGSTIGMLSSQQRGDSNSGGAASSLPASTDVVLSLEPNLTSKRLELVATATTVATTNNNAAGSSTSLLLRALAVYAPEAGGVFSSSSSTSASNAGAGRESVVAVADTTPQQPDAAAATSKSTTTATLSLSVPLTPSFNVSTELRVQAVVSAHHSSSHCAVIEKRFPLPKFAMFSLAYPPPPPQLMTHAVAAAIHAFNSGSVPLPKGSVAFTIQERAARVAMWMQSAFSGGLKGEHIMMVAANCAAHPGTTPPPPGGQLMPGGPGPAPFLEARFIHLRTGKALVISVSNEHYGGLCHIRSDEMALCGELLTDLCSYLGIRELSTRCDFPEELGEFSRTLERMHELSQHRSKLTGDSAASAGEVKALVIQGEDARLLADMTSVRQHYGKLKVLQAELVGEYNKRSANHAALVATLKEVNQMIQKAGQLRGESNERKRTRWSLFSVGCLLLHSRAVSSPLVLFFFLQWAKRGPRSFRPAERRSRPARPSR